MVFDFILLSMHLYIRFSIYLDMSTSYLVQMRASRMCAKKVARIRRRISFFFWGFKRFWVGIGQDSCAQLGQIAGRKDERDHASEWRVRPLAYQCRRNVSSAIFLLYVFMRFFFSFFFSSNFCKCSSSLFSFLRIQEVQLGRNLQQMKDQYKLHILVVYVAVGF